MIRYLGVALAAAALYVALGRAVSFAPPHGIDVWGLAFAGHATSLARIFTASCWWQALAVLGIIAIFVAVRYPAWRGRVLLALPTTLVTWQLSDLLKNVFHRARPSNWWLIHEPTYAYSSGHAMFALLVYGLWAWYIWHSNLPRPVRIVVAPLLALWGLGILWSRLALGAHYVTDLIGGVLLGTATLALALAIREAARRRSPA